LLTVVEVSSAANAVAKPSTATIVKIIFFIFLPFLLLYSVGPYGRPTLNICYPAGYHTRLFLLTMQRYDDFCYYANIYVILCAHTALLLTHIKNTNIKRKYKNNAIKAENTKNSSIFAGKRKVSYEN
jgi:hypothetical protein